MFFKALSVFINFIIKAIGKSLGAVVLLFPPSPFRFVEKSQYADFISQINFFIPIYEFIAITEAWLVAIAVYYAYSIWARWVNAID